MFELVKISKRAVVIGLVLVLSACAASYTNHGYAPTDLELENVIVGVDNRESVAETIGRPSSTGVLREGGWYYISSIVRSKTHNPDQFVDRQLVAISFDKKGIVSNIERFTLKNGRVLVLSQRKTGAGIKGISFIQQMLGNLGRVNLADEL